MQKLLSAVIFDHVRKSSDHQTCPPWHVCRLLHMGFNNAVIFIIIYIFCFILKAADVEMEGDAGVSL